MSANSSDGRSQVNCYAMRRMVRKSEERQTLDKISLGTDRQADREGQTGRHTKTGADRSGFHDSVGKYFCFFSYFSYVSANQMCECLAFPSL